MKLRLTLMLLCLFCVGMFAKSQDKKKLSAKPTVENGADPIPVIVTGTKKAHRLPPPPPLPPKLVIDAAKPSPPPPPPPKLVKDAAKHSPLPPPPPPPVKALKPTTLQPIPPTPPKKTDLQ